MIDAALSLTAQSHLLAWSVRDLAAALGVVPSVIYHHVGGKDAVARGVVERILDDVEAPATGTSWQAWFRELLTSIHPILRRYPGTASWLLMHGPAFPGITPVIDAGIAALEEAGFGDRVGLAYSVLLNNALLTISVGDERLRHEADSPRDHRAMMHDFQANTSGSPGVDALLDSMIRPLTGDPDTAAARVEEYYRFVVDVTIAGLEARLPGASTAAPSRSAAAPPG
ncbi:TetR/AcrR family transcriptional regulator [Myceligenerans pegani]|uniref:TetR/AcrR family transcriptional regulator n=1 Tax=Myceligenerans pegani TaxID=2776917 RepID=UPI00299E99E6|nr:TetR/AcrR family transcriptional regulator [Myceligenerans sp. TRM 65318]